MNSTGIEARNAHKSGTIQYGTTKTFKGNNAKYPAIYEQEKYAGVHRDAQGNLVEVSDVADGTQIITGSVDATAKGKMNPNGQTQSEDVYTAATTEKSKADAKTLTCTKTGYYFSNISSSYFDDANFYNMIFGTETYFWLASRYVSCNSLYAFWGLYIVKNGDLNGNILFCSSGDDSVSNYTRLAPVVTFDSTIQIKSGSGTTENPYIIGK